MKEKLTKKRKKCSRIVPRLKGKNTRKKTLKKPRRNNNQYGGSSIFGRPYDPPGLRRDESVIWKAADDFAKKSQWSAKALKRINLLERYVPKRYSVEVTQKMNPITDDLLRPIRNEGVFGFRGTWLRGLLPRYHWSNPTDDDSDYMEFQTVEKALACGITFIIPVTFYNSKENPGISRFEWGVYDTSENNKVFVVSIHDPLKDLNRLRKTSKDDSQLSFEIDDVNWCAVTYGYYAGSRAPVGIDARARERKERNLITCMDRNVGNGHYAYTLDEPRRDRRKNPMFPLFPFQQIMKANVDVHSYLELERVYSNQHIVNNYKRMLMGMRSEPFNVDNESWASFIDVYNMGIAICDAYTDILTSPSIQAELKGLKVEDTDLSICCQRSRRDSDESYKVVSNGKQTWNESNLTHCNFENDFEYSGPMRRKPQSTGYRIITFCTFW